MKPCVKEAIEAAVSRLGQDPVVGKAIRKAWRIARGDRATARDCVELLEEIKKATDDAVTESQGRGLDAAEAVRLASSGESEKLAENLAQEALFFWDKRGSNVS